MKTPNFLSRNAVNSQRIDRRSIIFSTIFTAGPMTLRQRASTGVYSTRERMDQQEKREGEKFRESGSYTIVWSFFFHPRFVHQLLHLRVSEQRFHLHNGDAVQLK